MGLRLKTTFWLGTALIVLIGTLYVYLSLQISRGYEELERQGEIDNTQRAQAIFYQFLNFLGDKLSDWSYWDDTYQYLADRNANYEESNLQPESMASLKINMMAFFDLEGKLIKVNFADIDKAEFIDNPPELEKIIDPGHQLLKFSDSDETEIKKSIIQLPSGFMMVAAGAVLTSEKKGPRRGTLIFGRYLDANFIKLISDMTKYNLDFFDLASDSLPADVVEIKNIAAQEQKSFIIRNINKKNGAGYVLIRNIEKKPVATLRVLLPRNIHAAGQSALLSIMIGLGVVLVASLIALLLIVDSVLLSRLVDLESDVEFIGLNEAFSKRLTVKGSQDELVNLSDKINDMLVKIESSQKSIKEKNRQLLLAQEEMRKAQSQLVQSQKMDSIGKLAGGIAHDFNNILGGIMGHAELLREFFKDEDESKNTERKRRKIEAIIKAAERGSSLTKQMLGFARETPNSKEQVNLNTTIDEVVEMLDRTLPKNIIVQVEKGMIQNILTSSTQMVQVVMNLCVNARDAMKDGGDIFISTRMASINADQAAKFEVTRGDYVCLEVRDTGSGISEKVREKIFDPFFTTKKQGEGTGLGLSVVYGIIKNGGGFIDVQSEEGKGTTFSIYLPVANLEATRNLADQVAV